MSPGGSGSSCRPAHRRPLLGGALPVPSGQWAPPSARFVRISRAFAACRSNYDVRIGRTLAHLIIEGIMRCPQSLLKAYNKASAFPFTSVYSSSPFTHHQTLIQ